MVNTRGNWNTLQAALPLHDFFSVKSLMEKSPRGFSRDVLGDSVANAHTFKYNETSLVTLIPFPPLSTAYRTPKSKFQQEKRMDFSRSLLSRPQLNEEELDQTQSGWS